MTHEGEVDKPVQATITPAEAAAKTWDVIVVGAGLAGGIATLKLARLGRRVLLLDRATFPRDKVCGACLNLDALAGLRALGLCDSLQQLGGYPLDRYEVRTGGKRLALSLPGGWAVSRKGLDALLVRTAIDAGANWLSPFAGKIVPADDSAPVRKVVSTDGQYTLNGSIVVVASGLASQPEIDNAQSAVATETNSRVGLGLHTRCFPETYQTGTIYMAVANGGYVGLTRTENGALNLAAAIDRGFLRQQQPEGACRAILQQAGFDCPAEMLQGAYRGTAALTRRRSTPASQRLFFVGDAAGYVEPFTGEGMAWAIRGGRAVVPLVQQGLEQWDPELATKWCHVNGQLIGRHQWLCRLFARGLRHPSWVQAAMGVAGACPALGRWIGRSVVTQLNRERGHAVLDQGPGHGAAA